MSAPEYAIVGRVRRAHGIRGELVVEPFSDAPDAIFASGRRLFVGDADGVPMADGRTATVRAARPFKEGLLLTIEGIADRNDAERWQGRHFLVPADELPEPDEDEVFFHDLIGMRVEAKDGAAIGEVVAIYELPQGLMLDVKRASGPTVMIPYRPEIVIAVDVDARVVHVDPPEGLFE